VGLNDKAEHEANIVLTRPPKIEPMPVEKNERRIFEIEN
jgi:hypothetical protein